MAVKATRVRTFDERRPRAARQERVQVGRRLAPREFDEQLERSARALAEALETQDLSAFYEMFRSTELPFLLAAHLDKPRGLYPACFDVLHRLGGLSPAVSLAIENHYYVSSALATFPVRGNPTLEQRRRLHLRSILDGRLLVANTNSRVHSGKVGSLGSSARREEGGLRVSGSAAYMSLAREGDLVFFLTQIENEGPTVLVVPLRGNPQIEIGPLLFPQMMVDSDTRKVTFHDAFVPDEGVLLAGKSVDMARLGAFQLAWHQALIPATFLGAAARALDEAKLFLRAVKGPNGQLLAELDGMVVDLGRMAIRYRSACGLARQAGEALESLARRARPTAFEDVLELACAAKLVGTKCAEEIVGEVRRIIGARAFTGTHPLERLSQEVMFGALAGEVNASIERRYGRRVLGADDFLRMKW